MASNMTQTQLDINVHLIFNPDMISWLAHEFNVRNQANLHTHTHHNQLCQLHEAREAEVDVSTLYVAIVTC